MPALIMGIISAAMSLFSSFSASQQQNASQAQAARVAEANAQITRQNAEAQAQAKEAEARVQDREKSRLRREYNQIQAQNTVSLGAGNVDMSSGSAMDVSMGNVQNFSVDMGENAFATALKKWEAEESRRIGNQQADVQQNQAEYLKKSNGNMLTSLLTGSLAGFGGFTSGYTQAGGKIGSLFGGNGK